MYCKSAWLLIKNPNEAPEVTIWLKISFLPPT